MMSYTKEEIQAAKARADATLIAYFKEQIPMHLQEWQKGIPALLKERLDNSHGLSPQRKEEISALLQQAKIMMPTPSCYQQSPEDYIQGGFLKAIPEFREDHDFILDIGRRFERVQLGFAYFSLWPAGQRPFRAFKLAQYQLRTGWQRTGIPKHFNQSVRDHHESGDVLAQLLFPDEPEVARRFRHHDLSEPVTGDFTLHDAISRADKTRIGKIAIRLVTDVGVKRGYAWAEDVRKAFDIYDGEAPGYEHIRLKMKDIDLLEMSYEMVFALEKCPEDEKAGLIMRFREFWDYIGPKLTSQRAKDFFEVAQIAKEGLPQGVKASELVRQAVDKAIENDSNAQYLKMLVLHNTMRLASRPEWRVGPQTNAAVPAG